MIVRPLTLAALLYLWTGCSQTEPVVVCDEMQFNPPSPLDCDAAIEAAMTALGAVHPQIVRITFNRGIYCPPGWECPMTSSEHGVVYFDFAWPAEDVYVEVTAEGGQVHVRSGPTPGSL